MSQNNSGGFGAVELQRNWTALAPKLIAFLATGLTASGVLFVLHAFGLDIPVELATFFVAAISSVAAYIKRDRLLELSPPEFSLKVVVFVCTSITSSYLLTLLGFFGIEISAELATVIVVVVSGVAGYLKSDSTHVLTNNYRRAQ